MDARRGSDAAPVGPSTRSTARRTLDPMIGGLGVIAVAFGLFCAAHFVAPWLIVLMYVGPAATLVGALMALGALVALVSLTAWLLIGRRLVMGSVLVSVATVVVGVLGLASGFSEPLLEGYDAGGAVVLCALCAAALGLFTGPLPLHLVGGIAALAAITVVVV